MKWPLYEPFYNLIKSQVDAPVLYPYVEPFCTFVYWLYVVAISKHIFSFMLKTKRKENFWEQYNTGGI